MNSLTTSLLVIGLQQTGSSTLETWPIPSQMIGASFLLHIHLRSAIGGNVELLG
jgi:hypothetical protein